MCICIWSKLTVTVLHVCTYMDSDTKEHTCTHAHTDTHRHSYTEHNWLTSDGIFGISHLSEDWGVPTSDLINLFYFCLLSYTWDITNLHLQPKLIVVLCCAGNLSTHLLFFLIVFRRWGRKSVTGGPEFPSVFFFLIISHTRTKWTSDTSWFKGICCVSVEWGIPQIWSLRLWQISSDLIENMVFLRPPVMLLWCLWLQINQLLNYGQVCLDPSNLSQCFWRNKQSYHVFTYAAAF